MVQSWEEIKEDEGKDLIVRSYKEGLLQTLFNAPDEEYRKKGWFTRIGIWSPYYFDLKNIGTVKDKELFFDLGFALVMLLKNEIPECNKVLGVAMKGNPLATAVSLIGNIPSLYTRPFPPLVKTVEEARVFLDKSDKGEYSKRTFLYGGLEDGDNIALLDDVATNFNSKLLAREILRYEAEKRGLNVICKNAVVVIDREQGADKISKSEGLQLHSLIPFKSKGLGWLKECMNEHEFAILSDYYENPNKFFSPTAQRETLELAAKYVLDSKE